MTDGAMGWRACRQGSLERRLHEMAGRLHGVDARQDAVSRQFDDLRPVFEWMADRYVAQTGQVSWGRYAAWTDRLAGIIRRWNPHAVLDVGCGPGYLLTNLRRLMPAAELVGLDSSPAMLSHLPGTVLAVEASVPEWRTPHGGRFDAAVLSFVLRDQPHPDRVLKAVATYLRPGGRVLVMETHTPGGWRHLGFELYFHHALPLWGHWSLTRSWTGDPALAPYRWLSTSHRRWQATAQLPLWLRDAGFTDPTPHAKPTEPIMVWSARLPTA